MTQITVTCPDCGDVRLTALDLELHADDRNPTLSHYRFDCPRCGEPVVKPADERVVMLLRSAGVPEPACAPAHPEQPHVDALAPLTHDELLDFHEQLADDAWLAMAIADELPTVT